MIMLDENKVAALLKNGAKVTSKTLVPAQPSELTDLLREMKRFSSAVVQVLQKEETPEAPDPAPIVSVAAPNVSVSTPPVPRRWRFTVTQWVRPPGTPPTAMMRPGEIIAEALD